MILMLPKARLLMKVCRKVVAVVVRAHALLY